MADKHLTPQTSITASLDGEHILPRQPRTILICEDDDGIRELLVEAIQEEGFSVHAARNGREALELLSSRQGRYLVLLDLMMPDISGYEILERMAADPQLPAEHVVIVLSATGFIRPVSPDVIQKRLIRGFLKKPFELDDLFSILREFI
jgi:CheY-like chemotaxis protein